ncbi:potassium/sodium hyperpolarization-activated cyclic nucleotide-gated channel 4 [Neodiprion pinetum]|uniref:potassium/sodium hyperpolarization-activated cyclic nucleotide-gated channel 4 n=1 Tax=Neodiprion pinetum TaxID=441929 RepID=UPI001EDEE325|nr:potassium/sodium hyperpolarization-activated cyclic nucleotide-gated channel 4-like [Neodiprion pinetum]
MVLSMYALCLILPYQAAFDMDRKIRGWTQAKNLFIGFFNADIIVNLRTGYYDQTLRTVQLDSWMVAKKYMFHGTFFVDLIGSIPTDIFFLAHWNELVVLREVTSLIIIFRGFSMYSYTHRLATSYDISIGIVNIIIFIGLIFLALHWQACFHYIVPLAVESLGKPKAPDDSSWIAQNMLWGSTPQTKYRSSLFRAVAIFTCSGFNGAPPSTMEDQYLAIIFQVLSVFIMCKMVGAMMQIYKTMNSSSLKYQAMTAQLTQYIRHKQLPVENQQRFMTYHEFRYQHNYFRESEILSTVSSQISQEIGMHSCRKLVENVTFFNNLPMSLLVRIVALLRSEIFLTNDVIVRANQPGDCMYFIASGTVAIYTKSGKEVCHLEDGAHFGEIALVMPDERRVASVVAVEICELYRLERADFTRTIHPYPMLWERIKKIAMERHEKTTILNAQ